MIDTEADLAAIFENDFTTDVVFAIDPDDSDQDLTVRGKFTAASEGVSLMGNVEVEASKPSVVCRTSQITTVKTKITATVDSVDYKVEKIEPTGVGTSVVWLKT